MNKEDIVFSMNLWNEVVGDKSLDFLSITGDQTLIKKMVHWSWRTAGPKWASEAILNGMDRLCHVFRDQQDCTVYSFETDSHTFNMRKSKNQNTSLNGCSFDPNGVAGAPCVSIIKNVDDTIFINVPESNQHSRSFVLGAFNILMFGTGKTLDSSAFFETKKPGEIVTRHWRIKQENLGGMGRGFQFAPVRQET